jgi:hypothetical protein
MRFLFLSNFFPRRRPAQAQTRPARTIWRLQYTVSARVFLGMQRSGTRQTLCALVRQRGNGGGDEARRLVGHRLVSRAALQFKGGAPMSTIAAAAQTADRIDYWIPPHIIQYCYGTYPSQLYPRGGRRVGMLAIGKCLKDQYDALATPMPRHLAVLVNQLEMQK